jgi:hypothetical protein
MGKTVWKKDGISVRRYAGVKGVTMYQITDQENRYVQIPVDLFFDLVMFILRYFTKCLEKTEGE